MKVLSKCRALTPDDVINMKVDCWLVSPVVDEVPKDVFEAIKRNGGKRNFVMLDPQGYMRVIDEGGLVTLKERLELDLSGVRAIKVDQQEMSALASEMDGLGGMQFLQSSGIEFVIATGGQEVHLLHRNTHYWVRLGNTEATDSTGAGDILSAAFCCSYMKENDALWALCFGAGAVRAALETGRAGLAKVPSIKKIEESATYFYHTVGFKQLS
jgi:sugar/nucleoside kinase (ribokinase family)